MTSTDPMLELFTAGTTDVHRENAAGQAVGLGGLLAVFITVVSVVGAAVTTVVLFAIAVVPLAASLPI